MNDIDDLVNSFKSISTEQIFEDCFEDYIYALFHNIIYPIQTVKELLNIEKTILTESQRLAFYSQLNYYFDSNNTVRRKLEHIPKKEELRITKINSYNYTINFLNNNKIINDLTICISLTNNEMEYFINTSQMDEIKVVETFFINDKCGNKNAVYISPKILKL
jgi:hypothetical protein